MTGTPCKVLILTADAGFGHRSAANAVAEALQLRYGSDVDVVIANPLDHKSTPAFLRDSQADYDRWVKEVPELYQLGYLASDSAIPTHILERTLGLLLLESMRETIASHQPDVILCTYPMYQSAVITNFNLHTIPRVPLYTVITDLYSIHRLWFHRKIDGCLVPNQHVAELAANAGISPRRTIITGIPVHPNISLEKRSPGEIRAELGWQPEIPTILAVGSSRVEHMMDKLEVINHFGFPLQLVVVAGRNEPFYQHLQEVEWHVPVHLYDFVENMPSLQRSSDLIVCKAGGLIVTESLACGLPMILVEVIPGQESGNAEYVVSSGAGDLVETPLQMLETLHHLMSDGGKLLRERARRAHMLGQPEAACKVATILWNAAHRPLPAATTGRRSRRRLIE